MSLNLYADVNALKRRLVGVADATAIDATDASEFEKVLDASSRRVEQFCNRHFYTQTATKVFHGNGKREMQIPDLVAATSVKLDEGEDGTFEITLAANTDYWLERKGYQDVDAVPKTAIILNTNGQTSAFPGYRRSLQIIGRWGFTEATEDSLATVAAPGWDATATTLTTAGAALPICAVGQTLLVGNEQMYVREASGSPQVLVVTRNVNGTTGAVHSAGAAIRRYVYLSDIVEAALEIASAMFKGRETAYLTSTIVNPVIGTIDVTPGIHPSTRALLMPYRIIPIG